MNYNHRKFLVSFIALSIILALLLYITRTFNSIGVFVFDFSLALSVIFIVLMWVKKETFVIWTKFAIIFLPVAIMVIALTPEVGGDFLFSFDKKIVTVGLAVIFFTASLIIIIVNSAKSKK